MRVNHIIIPNGPSMADPSHIVKLTLVNEDGSLSYLGSFGWRMWWRSFLVWAIIRHVRGLK